MAIHTEEVSEMQKGFTKRIDESGLAMMFDTLQKYQYSFPVKSTVRELLSNGIDSITEKVIAREILTGKAKVEDYYIEREGDLYKDSKFDPAYYDLNYLGTDNNVYLDYFSMPMERDRVVIRDYGVGLGLKRMEGYFSLGFSTKRLSKLPLGKFGLGAKSPLSLGIAMYTVENRYNGKLFRFNIYSHKVDSIIPKLNLGTGGDNGSILFAEGTPDEYQVYYETTEDKNGLTIIMESKKHHKTQYVDALKSQMLYFDDIVCTLHNEDGTEQTVNYKADIIYQDDHLVISDNAYYDKPHLLLNRVNYGYVNFGELELEDKLGNIGIKVAPEDVDVNPSRESVLWTDRTKDTILKKFREAVDIATNMLQEELNETDIIKWMRICYQIKDRYGRNANAISQLAHIVDLEKVKPKFPLNDRIRFSAAEPFGGMLMKHVTFDTRTDRVTKEVKRIISRVQTESLFSFYQQPIILMTTMQRAANRKDKWLLHLYPDGFTTVYQPYESEEKMLEGAEDEEVISFYKKSKVSDIIRAEIWRYLTESTESLQYDEIIVPDTFTGKDDEEEIIQEATKEDEQKAAIAAITAEQRRKLEGKTIVYTPELIGATSQDFSFTKIEIPIRDINEWEEEVYYGNDSDTQMLELVGLLTRDSASIDGNYRGHAEDAKAWKELKWWRLNKDKMYSVSEWKAYRMHHFFDTDVRLIRVAQANNKLYRDFRHVSEFIIQINNSVITMSNKLIKWNTARIIRDRMSRCAFLRNFHRFNPEYADMYRDVCKYIDDNFREVERYQGTHAGLPENTYQQLIDHLDTVQKFQEFVADPGANPESIAAMAKQLFDNRDLRDGMAVEFEIIECVDKMIEYAVACGDIFNYMPILTGYLEKPKTYTPNASVDMPPMAIPEELELEIKQLLEHKDVLQYGKENTLSLASPPMEEVTV